MAATYTVIRDVGETLKSVIQDAVSELSATNAVVFDSPAELNPGGSPKLSVFLYRIAHNPHLRNTPPAPVSVTEMGYPPLSLDLMYLFTPFSNNIETEFIIIEKLLQAFYDRPVIAGDDLQGSLVENGNTEFKIVPDELSLDEINKLWTAFPNKPYRLAVSYMISPIFVPSSRGATIHRVTTRTITYTSTEEGA